MAIRNACITAWHVHTVCKFYFFPPLATYGISHTKMKRQTSNCAAALWNQRNKTIREKRQYGFTEGCAGANTKALLPGRQQRCTFSPTTFSSVAGGRPRSLLASCSLASSACRWPVITHVSHRYTTCSTSNSTGTKQTDSCVLYASL